MQNINLLEDIFDLTSEGQDEDAPQKSTPTISGNEQEEAITEMKVRLRSNPTRIDNLRKRIQQTIDQGFRKLQKHSSSNLDDSNNVITDANLDHGKASAWDELNDRLNKARNVEDLKMCSEMSSRIRNQQKASAEKTEGTEIANEGTKPGLKESSFGQESEFCPMKLVRNVEIDQDTLRSMDSHFSSLEEIEDL